MTIDRSQRLTSDDDDKLKNKEIVKNILLKIGYHPNNIEKRFVTDQNKPSHHNEPRFKVYGLP